MVLRYKKLIALWETYQEAIKAKPYDGDKIQSWGLAFAKEWNMRKDDIVSDFKPEEFTYAIKHEVMKKVFDVRRSLTKPD